MSHPKPANASVTPEEMASLRKAARRSAGRSSDPEIVSFSDGREAAAYHAEPVAPPAAIDQTVSNGDVLLSSTLRREVALANEKPPQAVAEVAPVAPEARESSRLLEETVRAPSSRAPAPAGRPWMLIALVAVGAVVLLSTVALVVGLSSSPAPAASTPAAAPPSASIAPAIVATVAPTIAPPESATPASSSASTAPTPAPPERPHRGNRRPSPPPASSKGGSDGMIVPPL
jgi:hypothetical protein